MDTPLKGIERVTVLDARIWPLNSRNPSQFPQLRFCVEFGFRYSQLSWRMHLRCDFCRLMKPVMYAKDAEKRWRPISALFVSTSQAWTRTRITVTNVESAGEFPKTEVVCCLA